MNYDLFIPPAVLERATVSAPSDHSATGRSMRSNSGRPDDAQTDGLLIPGMSRNPRDVHETVAALNDVFDQANVELRYRVDNGTDDLVVAVVNRDTGEVLRQVPPEEILRMRQRLQEMMGLMFDVTA